MNKNYIPALLCLLGITALSVTPNMQLPKFELVSTDKLGHALAYGTLCWLVLWGLERKDPAAGRPGSRQSWYAFAFCAGYGVLMEFVQYAFIPGRFCEFDDMIANVVGALTGWLAFRIYLRAKYNVNL